jgi:hypothetical protein
LKKAFPLTRTNNPFYKIDMLDHTELKVCAQAGIPSYLLDMLIQVNVGASGVDPLTR